MTTNPTAIGNKIERVINGWGDLAEGSTFGGFTLEQFQEAVQPSLAARAAVTELETQLNAARIARDNADVTSMEDVLNVVNSVRGNPAYGENSALYASFGYKRKADYESGLTRKSDQPEPIQLLKAA